MTYRYGSSKDDEDMACSDMKDGHHEVSGKELVDVDVDVDVAVAAAVERVGYAWE